MKQLLGWALVGALVITAGCGDKDKKKKTARPAVMMQLDAEADLSKDFFAQPFPLESRRGAVGNYELAGFPNPVSFALVEFLKQEIAEDLAGYGTNAAVYMTFSGALDFANAITDDVANVQGKAATLLLNIDKGSPDYLKFTRNVSRFYPGNSRYLPTNTLAIAPMPGFPLRGNTLYAAIVLNDYGLAASAGQLVQAPALREALAGQGKFSDAYLPLREALPLLGIDESKVIGATVYRTMDFAAPLMKARDWLHAKGPAPDAYIESSSSTPASFRWFEGKFTNVRFQHGGEEPFVTPGDGGFKLDADGVPIPAGTEEIRFALSLPKGTPPPGGWPLVIYAHGTGGDWRSAIPYGDTENDEGVLLARKKIALVSYDQPYHGERNSRVDDCTSTCPQLYTFNFLNPKAARDGFRQSALDAVQLLRAMLTLEVAGGETFNPEKIYYMGHSQGSTSGPMFVAIEPMVKAAVFSGPAGGLTMTFLYKTEPVDIPAIVAPVLRDEQAFDLFHPLMNLFQAYLEPVDPMNYARLVAQEPREAGIVRDVLITEGLTDKYTPPVQAEAFAIALGIQPVTPVFQDLLGFEKAGLEAIKPGFSENRTNIYGDKWTGALLQYPDNGHFSIYCQENASIAYADFLASVEAGSRRIEDYGSRRWESGDALDLGCGSPQGAPSELGRR